MYHILLYHSSQVFLSGGYYWRFVIAIQTTNFLDQNVEISSRRLQTLLELC